VVKAAVFGASGYAGGELIKALLRHPQASLSEAYAGAATGSRIADIHPFYPNAEAEFQEYDPSVGADADIVFLALPHGEAMKLAPKFVAAGQKVIDLSGDHRIADAQTFERYYKMPLADGMASSAVYGLPEWWSEQIAKANLIANPGCYATSAILPLAPLVKENLIDTSSITITSMSGVSGAGRKAALDYNFSEVNESIKAYRVGDHQHVPEIEQALSRIAGSIVQVTFIPHLVPITRGIYTTITVRTTATEAEIENAFVAHYGAQPFVRFSNTRIPEIRRVVHTNFIDIGYRLDRERGVLVVMSTIDNLVKGAAGQAIQNMNLQFGFGEREGLV
jgi:N-acetyl-gamma-glutamyl-phosphate reductase